MVNNKNVPELRFKGFTDDWEQRKLGDVSQLRGGFAFKSESYKKKGIPIIRISNILSNGTVGDDYIYYEPQENDDIFSLTDGAALLAMSGATTGKISILQAKSNEKFYQNQRVGYFTKNESYNYSFISIIVRTQLFANQLGAVLVAGAQPNVSNKDIDSFSFYFPITMEEQKKIGTIFANLDNLITLHQSKCDTLKTLKTSLLQKMFPQEGQTKPELRFKGFTDDWEQRKLGELVERVTRKNSNLQSLVPLTISAQKGLINQNEYFGKRIASNDISGYYLVFNGEFAYNKSTSADAPFGAIKRLDYYNNGVLSTLYIVFRISKIKNLSSNFLATYYDTDCWHKGIKAIAAEGARNHGLLNIASKDFFETSLCMPHNIEEQSAIGNVLKTVDNLITLHQQKVELLKAMKSALLNKMFV